ncbi:TonB-dependent receptor [Aurantiacibacter aquimixticola]|uniref:TonB-dependent receptor n=1 Tax=Aurantiacibacter aquimixticola TaxID=1958945 RepID=A0A419RVV6_9SPHN|nr:TonB-dependent receptor [Aurantiacibacter aquimixticola]RJY09903.1 TonB-dependent receptor [Aurantiacibacter aquimixticola]
MRHSAKSIAVPAGRNRAVLKGSLLASAVLLTPAGVAQAQVVSPDEDEEVVEDAIADPNTIVVTGDIARTIENSLDAKRDLDVIGDAIVGEDVGDLPDLSVAETLERIVGVTSDRFKGGASELSVRGLGAFLGSSVLNGREVTSGSDGRDVNYGQFPSELINGAIVYKSQQANFIEGGVSGIIELQTLRPLDYGKSRFQLQGLLGYSDYEDRVVDGDPFSQRLTASLVEQFESEMGDFGIAIGGQIRRDTSPEDIFTSSSTYSVCNQDFSQDGGSNCDFDPDNSGPQYFVSNQYIYRALETNSDRDAVLGAVQWQPANNLDINIDAQYSYRDEREDRQNLIIADGRRRITPLAVSETGALLAWEGETRLEINPFRQDQTEEYIGLGANVEWEIDRLTLAVDAGYSQTERRRDELDIRIRTDDRVDFRLDFRDVEVPVLTFLDVSDVEDDIDGAFDLNNYDQYTNGLRVRRRQENVDDDILAFRFDGQYDFDGALAAIRAGVRYADRQRVRDDGIDRSSSDRTDPIILENGIFDDAAVGSRIPFPVENFYEGADTSMTGLTFASFDPYDLFFALTEDRDAGLPIGSTLSTDDTDVSEETWAGYVQADLDLTLFGLPARGDVGIRAVHTEITSLGISSALATTPGDDPGTIDIEAVGDPIINTETNSFWNFLPSANLTLELNPDMLLRLAAYRAIARPDPEAMTAALDIDNESDAATIGQAISAAGNPFLEPLESWNGDVSFEWYAAETTSLSVAAYYKSLQTGFDTDVSTINVVVNGVDTPVEIARTVNSDDTSRIYGFEVTAQHQFDFGLGFQASYNFADSNFEFPDPTIGRSGETLADFIEPANIPGYSKHSANATLFYETGPLSTRIAYKWRSDYFKPFRSTSNRFAGDQGFLDFSASYDLIDNVELRFQVLNILDEPNLLYRPTRDSLAQSDFSGTRYFIGLRGRF